MMTQKPAMRATRKESLRFHLGSHLRDYRGALKYDGPDEVARYAEFIRKRLEQLGGLAGRW